LSKARPHDRLQLHAVNRLFKEHRHIQLLHLRSYLSARLRTDHEDGDCWTVSAAEAQDVPSVQDDALDCWQVNNGQIERTFLQPLEGLPSISGCLDRISLPASSATRILISPRVDRSLCRMASILRLKLSVRRPLAFPSS